MTVVGGTSLKDLLGTEHALSLNMSNRSEDHMGTEKVPFCLSTPPTRYEQEAPSRQVNWKGIKIGSPWKIQTSGARWYSCAVRCLIEELHICVDSEDVEIVWAQCCSIKFEKLHHRMQMKCTHITSDNRWHIRINQIDLDKRQVNHSRNGDLVTIFKGGVFTR
ncbi:hypothetical protein Pelo_415 [Pelomyxa schiedti]|nr:hypothetical protein Pelo_415 [Pelomyxa schiedti]